METSVALCLLCGPGKKQDSHIPLCLAVGFSIRLLRVGGGGFQAQEMEEEGALFIVGGNMNSSRLLQKKSMLLPQEFLYYGSFTFHYTH